MRHRPLSTAKLQGSPALRVSCAAQQQQQPQQTASGARPRSRRGKALLTGGGLSAADESDPLLRQIAEELNPPEVRLLESTAGRIG